MIRLHVAMQIILVAALIALVLGSLVRAEENHPAAGTTFYGQINRGVLFFDDGQDSDLYAFVDNSKSTSRLGLKYDAPLDNDWRFQARGEVGLIWKETNRINQLDPNDSDFELDKESLRKLEVSFAHDQYGFFFIGQGAMASDGVTGQDLSLTNVVAGAAVKDVAGGFFFRRKDGTLTNFRIKDRFRTLGSSRRLRLRYDTTTRNNLNFSLAAGKEVLDDRDRRYYADAAMRYDRTQGDFRYKAAAAIRWAGGNPDTDFRRRDLNFIVSGSVLHKPSRYNLTLGYGIAQDAGYYTYTKLGRRWYDLLPWGWTAFSIDYYYTKDGPDRDQIGKSIGLAAVQQIKAHNLDIYATIRRYDYDDPDADYFDTLAVLTGVRWRF